MKKNLPRKVKIPPIILTAGINIIYFSHREATEQGYDQESNREKQKQHLLVPGLQSKFKRPKPVQPKEKQ
jgi:hypothetical protein